MVSTYSSYNAVVRNLGQSLTRVSQQSDVARSAAYYKDNIGKVKTVDDLMGNYRLYQYAMKAYGLEDMSYAKAFMKKVLASDLTDANSFANKLSDKRYRDFAAAFSFTAASAEAAQSAVQTDEMAGLYTKAMSRKVDAIYDDKGYYNATIGSVKTVDELLNNDKLRTYVFSAFGIDDSRWSRDTIKNVLSSDPSDPDSYVNTVWTSRQEGIDTDILNAQTELENAGLKIAYYQTQLSEPDVDAEDLRAKIVFERSRQMQLSGAIISFNDALDMIDKYVALAGAFDFLSDGTLADGVPAQTEANQTNTNDKFIGSKGAVFLGADEANETRQINLFRAALVNVKSSKAFVTTPNVYNFALQSVGLDPDKVSAATIKAVLESDANDPKSFVNTLKDDRYVQLARAFNFDSKGNLMTPLVAQGSNETIQVAKNYIIAKTKFASAVEAVALRSAATKEVTYYQETLASIDSISDLLANKRMVSIILTAKGLDPAKVDTEYLRKILSSNLDDPKSFANTASDPRFAEIAASFNFDSKGNVARLAAAGPQQRDQFLATQKNYLQQSLETQQGEQSPGVRLALYFQRKAPGITSAFDILADKALSEVFRTAFNLPDGIAAMPIDAQAKLVEKTLKLKDLSDPVKLGKLLSRFSAMYDLKNNIAAA